MKLYYRFTEAEAERYFDACEAMLAGTTAPRIAGQLAQSMGAYIAGQTIREWFDEAGRIPSDVAVVLADVFTVKLEHLCPWLKGYKKKGRG